MEREEIIESRLAELIEDDRWDDVKVALAELHPADIADIIEQAPSDEHEKLFRLVDTELQPDVLSELRTRAEADVLEGLSTSELAPIVAEMEPDDAADLVAHLSEEEATETLALMESEDASDIRELLKYDEETAGGIMTPDFVAMGKDQSVEEALHAIADLESDEPFIYANVVDTNGIMIGYVSVWELLRERDKARPLSALAHTSFVSVKTDMDQEEVTYIMSKYDLSVIPVISEDGRLVGRVTSDDAIDVMEEEASEDIFRLAGSDDVELEETSIIKTCMVRLPWLLVTLFGGFLVSLILRRFHAYISPGDSIDHGTLALAAFVPTVLAMGGNAAIQSSTLVVRSLALDTLGSRRIPSFLFREILVGALMGSCCGILIGSWASFVSDGETASAVGTALSSAQLGMIVAAALFCAMSFATFFGASVPMILDKFKIDPAVASGPFVTIANDISALLIYFASTALLIRLFA